jgi:hypothetical protein
VRFVRGNSEWVNTGFFERIALPLALVALATLAVIYRDGVIYSESRREARQTKQVVSITASLFPL